MDQGFDCEACHNVTQASACAPSEQAKACVTSSKTPEEKAARSLAKQPDIMVFIYDLVLRVYHFSIWLASFFQKKARLWISGRWNMFDRLEKDMAARRQGQKMVWMHCASLGEFEQGRPILEAIRRDFSGANILLTFFSPSGFEIRKNYNQADWVNYLPADTPGNARRFVDLVKPDLTIFVKYEFWYHHLYALKRQGRALFLVAALFRPGQPFFRWYGGLHRRMLGCFTQIFVQDEASKRLLSGVTSTPVEIAGDTRVDRVRDMAMQAKVEKAVGWFCSDAPVLVAGSTWPPDEEILLGLLQEREWDNWRFLIASHDVSPPRIDALVKKLKGHCVRYSDIYREGLDIHASNVLIIDNVGMLASLYRYGKIAYIGGGFGKGIHNILEPMAFGLPVLFGPRYRKFAEARWLVQAGGGFPVRKVGEAKEALRQLLDPSTYERASLAARQYLDENKGATMKIMGEVRKVMGLES